MQFWEMEHLKNENKKDSHSYLCQDHIQIWWLLGENVKSTVLVTSERTHFSELTLSNYPYFYRIRNLKKMLKYNSFGNMNEINPYIYTHTLKFQFQSLLQYNSAPSFSYAFPNPYYTQVRLHHFPTTTIHISMHLPNCLKPLLKSGSYPVLLFCPHLCICLLPSRNLFILEHPNLKLIKQNTKTCNKEEF